MASRRASNSRIMPVANYIVATAPLDDPRRAHPGDAAISDSRFVVNYYRLTADGRLLFGGGERYLPTAPADIAAFVRPLHGGDLPGDRGRGHRSCLGRPGFDHHDPPAASRPRWRGPVRPRLFSGMGAVLSTLAGKLLAERHRRREPTRFDLFAGRRAAAVPRRVAPCAGPLHVLGMLWYALRDRLVTDHPSE